MISFSGLYKYCAAFVFILLFASSSALANDRDVPSYPPVHPANEFIVEDAPGGQRHEDLHISLPGESLEDAAAIPLRTRDDQIILSLAPSLENLSLNPIDDIKNVQIFLRYRF